MGAGQGGSFVRIGLVGAGRIGAAHATVVAAHPEVTELVVADTDGARAAAVAERVGATTAADADALFAARPAGVVVAAPTSEHAKLLVQALEAGIPVFCEKPVAPDVVGTREVLEVAGRTGVPVQVGFQRRFDAGYVAARAALQRGELGELRRVHVVTADPAPPHAAYIPTSGGIFRDCHIHDFDVVHFVTGRAVVEVYASGANRGARFFRAAGDVDESAALLTLDDGTLVTLQGSRYNGAGYDVRMELAGTRATWVVGLDDRAPLHSAEAGVAFPAGPAWPAFWERFSPAYVAEMHAFVDVVAGRRSSACTVGDALAALYVAEAADLSRRTHRPVTVEEVRRP